MKKKDYKICRQVTLGTDESGKPVRKRIYANSKRELEREMHAAMSEFEKLRNPSEITFGKYCEKWLDASASKWKPNTERDYRLTVRKFDPISGKRLRDITRSDMQLIINENWELARTCRKISMTARQIFENALDDGIIAYNPMRKLSLPDYHAREMRALTPAELAAVRKLDLDQRHMAAVKIAYYFGLRPEETRGLMSRDFDFRGGEVTVCRAVAHVGNDAVLDTTKNGKVRKVPIPSAFAPELRAYIQSLNSPYLFTMQGGGLMTAMAWRRFSEPVFARMNELMGGNGNIGLADGPSWYTFRHDFGTRLYYTEGISLKMKAYIMGHSERVFLDIYSHLDRKKEDVSALLSVAL